MNTSEPKPRDPSMKRWLLPASVVVVVIVLAVFVLTGGLSDFVAGFGDGVHGSPNKTGAAP